MIEVWSLVSDGTSDCVYIFYEEVMIAMFVIGNKG